MGGSDCLPGRKLRRKRALSRRRPRAERSTCRPGNPPVRQGGNGQVLAPAGLRVRPKGPGGAGERIQCPGAGFCRARSRGSFCGFAGRGGQRVPAAPQERGRGCRIRCGALPCEETCAGRAAMLRLCDMIEKEVEPRRAPWYRTGRHYGPGRSGGRTYIYK